MERRFYPIIKSVRTQDNCEPFSLTVKYLSNIFESQKMNG